MSLKRFQRKSEDSKNSLIKSLVKTPDLETTLEQLAQVRQQTYAVLTNTAPKDKNALNKVFGAVDSYETVTETFIHHFNSEPLGTNVITPEIYSKTLTFLMNYVQHRFSTTNNPGIWLSTPFLEEYYRVHGKLQEISRKLSPTKAFLLVHQFLTQHDQLLEKCVKEITPQLENMDEKLFREVHTLTTLSALTGDVKIVYEKLNQYHAFTNTYSLVLGETFDDMAEVAGDVREELEFYHRNPSLIEELKQRMGNSSHENFPAKMERFLESRRYSEGPLEFELFVKYKLILPEQLRLLDEKEKQKADKREADNIELDNIELDNVEADKVESETNISDPFYKPVYVYK
ncbi:hypothetical protein HYU21_04720 [Candidatus Woesearchaeota archaeon]|nr:hypothetical protein [Candidatus Woesearchaeota archaeon]